MQCSYFNYLAHHEIFVVDHTTSLTILFCLFYKNDESNSFFKFVRSLNLLCEQYIQTTFSHIVIVLLINPASICPVTLEDDYDPTNLRLLLRFDVINQFTVSR